MNLDHLKLPSAITSLAEMSPVEDLGLRVLRAAMPNVRIVSLIESDQKDIGRFWILVRRTQTFGIWDGDERFIDNAGLSIDVFAYGTEADEIAAVVSEACRVALRDSAERRDWFPDLGGFLRVRMIEEPTRKTDWATSTGPVQFADLPTGYQRYEAQYQVWIRKP